MVVSLLLIAFISAMSAFALTNIVVGASLGASIAVAFIAGGLVAGLLTLKLVWCARKNEKP